MFIGLLTREQLWQTGSYHYEIRSVASASGSETAVYVHGDAFLILTDSFLRSVPYFEPYGITVLTSSSLEALVRELPSFARRLASTDSGPAFVQMLGVSRSSERLGSVIDQCLAQRGELVSMINDLSEWLLEQFSASREVTVFGL